MTRAKIIIVIAAAAFATAGAATAASLGGADVATGHGYAIPCPPGSTPPFPGFCATTPREFRFAAESNLASGRAAGTLWIHGTFCSAPGVCTTGSFRARVFCVRATGNEATIGAIVERTELPTHPVGRQVHLSVVDNGRAGDPVPDLLSLNFFLPVPDVEGQCLAVLPPAYQTVVEGDIRVRDGQLVGNP